jgi:hypothetical protein
VRKELRLQWGEFVRGGTTGGSTWPQIEVKGESVTKQPFVSLGCEIEQVQGEEETKAYSLRLMLYISERDSDDLNDNVTLHLSSETDMSKLFFLFKEDTFPVLVLMDQPDQECVGAIIAHTIARKADYQITAAEERHNNEVRFSLDLGKSQFVETTVNRDQIRKYFGWEALAIEKTL